MSVTQKIYAKAFAFLDFTNQGANLHTGNQVTLENGSDRILLKFNDVPSSMQFKRISAISLSMYCRSAVSTDTIYGYGTVDFSAFDGSGTFDENTVTYASWPQTSPGHLLISGSTNISDLPQWKKTYALSGSGSYGDVLVSCLGNCAVASAGFYKAQNAVFDVSGANAPYIEITVDDTTLVDTLALKSLAPASGAINRFSDSIFTWGITTPTLCIPKLVQASATFRWRASGSSTVHEVSLSGSANSVTIPKNTFPSGNIQWQIMLTANSGKTTTSEWITLSASDQKPTAETVAPQSIVIDASVSNKFTWRHIISTGTEQTKADLQISSDNSTWAALATVVGSSNSYTVPANTLGSGTKYWRVRTYNTDNVASEWSASAQFVSVGAPDAPVVVIQSTTPRPSISWQVTGQQAYQVEIDGVTASGTRFGTNKSYRSPAYLADGSYTVRVRVQNEYGFWSPWGTAALPVTNIPGGAITLTASTENAVTLAWVDSDNYDFYIVYRDGTPIAKAEEHGYVDNMAIGACTYQVRGCYSDNDYYGVSAEVSVSVTPEYNVLYDMDAGEWLTMKYSGLTNQPVTRSISRSIAEVRLSGYTYPVAERSKAKTATYDGNVVFLNRDSAEKFEGMIGHLVCLKLHPSGGCIGYLNEVSGEVNQYKSVYSFMVTQIEYEEEIDIDS